MQTNHHILLNVAEKDTTKGMDGWERFDFDKDAPLDDDEIEGNQYNHAVLLTRK